MLSPAQCRLLDLLTATGALRFGDFTLKSGRRSPYFINTGCFNRASHLTSIGACYADGLQQHFGHNFDCIFGPAYKGIPLALTTATALQAASGRDCGWAFDRKETKTHGDAGNFVGMPLSDGIRVVLVDDVLTAGTALRESLAKLSQLDVEVAGVLISVDREEPGPAGRATARQELSEDHDLPVHALIGISTAADHLCQTGVINPDMRQRITDYQQELLQQ